MCWPAANTGKVTRGTFDLLRESRNSEVEHQPQQKPALDESHQSSKGADGAEIEKGWFLLVVAKKSQSRWTQASAEIMKRKKTSPSHQLWLARLTSLRDCVLVHGSRAEPLLGPAVLRVRHLGEESVGGGHNKYRIPGEVESFQLQSLANTVAWYPVMWARVEH